MIVTVKVFSENSNEDFARYNELWDQHRNNMVFFQCGFGLRKKDQIESLIAQIEENKHIISIRFKSWNTLGKNNILKEILQGRGFHYGETHWYPTEIWMYSPFFCNC